MLTVTTTMRRWVDAQVRQHRTLDDIMSDVAGSPQWSPYLTRGVVTELIAASQDAERKGLPLSEFGGRMPSPFTLPTGNTFEVGGHIVQVAVSLTYPQIMLINDFFSGSDCDELVEWAEAQNRLASSDVHGNPMDKDGTPFRSSYDMGVSDEEHPLIQKLNQYMSDLLDWPLDHTEELQLLRYQQGQQFKTHHDFFGHDEPDVGELLANGGHRIGTIVVYLNSPTEGGTTTFPDLGLTVHPVKGSALFFAYPLPCISTLTAHSGDPVVHGEKWVAVRWFRERAVTTDNC